MQIKNRRSCYKFKAFGTYQSLSLTESFVLRNQRSRKKETLQTFNRQESMTENNLNIKLRPTEISDLDILFEFQLDKESGYLAAFMPQNPTDKLAYKEKHTKL